MARKKLDLNALEVDSFATLDLPTRDAGTVRAHILTADTCGGGDPPSWQADCTVGCTTNTNYDGPTCGYPNCGQTQSGATWNNPSCEPNYTCGNAGSCAVTGCAAYSCGMC